MMTEGEGEYREYLRIFVGLANEWQDHLHHRPALELDIRDEALKLVDRTRGSLPPGLARRRLRG